MRKKTLKTSFWVALVLAVAFAIYYATAYLIQYRFGAMLGKDMIPAYLLAAAVWSLLIPAILFANCIYAALTNKPMPARPTRNTSNDSCDCPCIVICL